MAILKWVTPNKLSRENLSKKKIISDMSHGNMGKTFLLKPLTLIYNCFFNPTFTTFAWVGAEEAKIIFLNDFRWSEKLIPWSDLLNLLKGEPIHITAPKTHFAQYPVGEKRRPSSAPQTQKSKSLNVVN